MAKTNAGDVDMVTPLHIAVMKENHQALDNILATAGVNVNAGDKNNQTPLHYAVGQQNHQALNKLLAAAGVNVNAGDKNKVTPLHYAVLHENHQALDKILATAGVNVNAGDKNKLTPLHCAVLKENHQAVDKLLASKGINANAGNVDKRTPLHYASVIHNVKAVEKLLVVPGINPNLRDVYGNTPVMNAAKKNDRKLLEIFVNDQRVDLDVRNGQGQGLEELLAGRAECLEVIEEGRKKRLDSLKKLDERKKLNEKKQNEERKLNEKKQDEERKEAERNRELEAKKNEDGQKEREMRNTEKILAEQKILLEKKQDKEVKEAKREKKKEDDRKDQERIEMETIRKRQEEKKLRDQRRVDPKEEIKAQFQTKCKDASTCLVNMVPKSSMEGYGEVLVMSTKNYDVLWPATKYKDSPHNEELVVIKYMFAKACAETNNYDCILAGLERLDEIRNSHSSVRFPTMFYGYAVIWIKLNRFSKAAEAVKEGLDFLNQGVNVTRHNWPGLPRKLLEETSREVLLEKLKTLAAQIKSSPQPDAVCRLENCEQVQASAHILPSQNIYCSDPDYKGYYKVFCRTDCQVCYHKACWMNVKGKQIEKSTLVKGPTKKDLLGLTCFTPDCDAMIIKIEIIEDNGKVTTIQDMKIIEKLKVEKEKSKGSNNREKEKSKGSNKGEKEKSKGSNKGEKENLDPLPLQQQNESLMLELQETKDKLYKIQSERKLERKEYNDKCMAMAEDVKNLKKENYEMKKAVSDATKTSNELKKTTEALNTTKSQLKETQTSLREALSRNTQLNDQLASLSRTKDAESRTSAIHKIETDQSGAMCGEAYDKLVSQLQTDHPSLSQEQACTYLMELRASKNGKLSGMVRQDILNKVASYIWRDRGILDGASAVERSGSIVDGANADKNECSICLEDMVASDSLYLNPCGHRFHTGCINQWLESPGGAGSTCPICRNYIVKEEEFPKLG